MAYEAAVDWENFPSLKTALSAANLKAMEDGLVAYFESVAVSKVEVQGLVEEALATLNAQRFRGYKDCSANPKFPAANAGDTYIVSVAGKIGGAAGYVVGVGDCLICTTDGAAEGTKGEVGAKWDIVDSQATVEGAVGVEKARAEAAESGKQPIDTDLTAIAGLSPEDGALLVRTGGTWAALAKGSSGQELVVRSDGTIAWQTPAALKASAWGMSTGASATVNTAAFKAAIAAAAEQKTPVRCPGGTLLLNEYSEPENYLTLEGEGPEQTILKVASGAKCGILKSKRYGEGGETGGTEDVTLRNIAFDGNVAENAGITAGTTVLDLDGIRPVFEGVLVRNGLINAKTKMSRNNKSSSRPEDGYFTYVWSFNAKEFGWLFEGPHDSHGDHIWIKSDEGKNFSVRTVSVWSHVHVYGNAKRGIESWAAAEFNSCIAEGAEEGQVFLGDNAKWRGGEVFYGGGKDGKIGFVLGDSEHSAFEVRITDVEIRNCTNGAFKFNHAAQRSYIDAQVYAESGKVWVEGTTKPDVSVKWGETFGWNGVENNQIVEEVASANEVNAANRKVLLVSGTTEITNLHFGLVGQQVTLKFMATGCKVANNAHFELSSPFVSNAGDTLTLINVTGAIWSEIGRKQPLFGEVAAANTMSVVAGAVTMKVTGNTEIKKINVTYPGQTVTLIFEGTPKVANGENLKLGASFQATANSTLTLTCDGVNWYPA